jgi:hypothetical protein
MEKQKLDFRKMVFEAGGQKFVVNEKFDAESMIRNFEETLRGANKWLADERLKDNERAENR